MIESNIGLEDRISLSREIRALADERGAAILAHNYQAPEIQDVADHVGDSLALAGIARTLDAETLVMCGVHFMAETTAVLCPDRTVLLPDHGAGCSLAESITADELREWKARFPGSVVVMYVNTSAAVKAETDWCCTSTNAVDIVRKIWRDHGEDMEILFGPDMFLGAYVEKTVGRPLQVWMGECHVHVGIRPEDIGRMRAERPDAELLVHPECGCTTSVMEYVAAGDVESAGTHLLSTGAMQRHAKASPAKEFVVATEVGMLHTLERENPGKEFVAANPEAACRYMKMITLTKVRDALRDGGAQRVSVPPAIAERARVPIERMLSLAA